jgi:hypothetical protein
MTDTTPFAESGPGTDVNADAQSALFDAPTPTPAATDESGSSDAMTLEQQQQQRRLCDSCRHGRRDGHVGAG